MAASSYQASLPGSSTADNVYELVDRKGAQAVSEELYKASGSMEDGDDGSGGSGDALQSSH